MHQFTQAEVVCGTYILCGLKTISLRKVQNHTFLLLLFKDIVTWVPSFLVQNSE